MGGQLMTYTAAPTIANIMAPSYMGGGGNVRLSTSFRAPNRRDPNPERYRKNVRNDLPDHNRPSSQDQYPSSDFDVAVQSP